MNILEFLSKIQFDLMLFLSGGCAILLILSIMTKTKSPGRKRALIFLETAATFLLMFDRCAYQYRGDVSTFGYYMVRISNFMVFFLTLSIVHGFNLYLMDLYKYSERKSVPRLLLSGEAIFSIGLILLIISQFTGLYYTFDEFNRYHRSPGFIICYACPLIMILSQLFTIIKNRKLLRKNVFTFITLFSSIPLVASVLQIFAYGVSLTNISLVGMSALLYIFELQEMNKQIEEANQREIDLLKDEQAKIRTMLEQTAQALATAIDAKDKYTHGHSSRVADYSRMIAKRAGLPEKDIEETYYAALLHDVGKIGVNDAIINKDGKLTDEEFAEIKKHPVIGSHILSTISESPYLKIGANYHHERYDGKGYPENLAGNDIPEMARIIAVADAYDAMTSKRSYRDPLPQQKVRDEIQNGLGKQFDPKYGQIMLDLIDEDSNYNMREN